MHGSLSSLSCIEVKEPIFCCGISLGRSALNVSSISKEISRFTKLKTWAPNNRDPFKEKPEDDQDCLQINLIIMQLDSTLKSKFTDIPCCHFINPLMRNINLYKEIMYWKLHRSSPPLIDVNFSNKNKISKESLAYLTYRWQTLSIPANVINLSETGQDNPFWN